jgi:hypothetical protein
MRVQKWSRPLPLLKRGIILYPRNPVASVPVFSRVLSTSPYWYVKDSELGPRIVVCIHENEWKSLASGLPFSDRQTVLGVRFMFKYSKRSEMNATE